MNFWIPSVTGADLPGIADLINAHSLAKVGTLRALFDADGDLRTARYIPGAASDGSSPTPTTPASPAQTGSTGGSASVLIGMSKYMRRRRGWGWNGGL